MSRVFLVLRQIVRRGLAESRRLRARRRTHPCPSCARQIPLKAVKCPYCATWLGWGTR